MNLLSMTFQINANQLLRKGAFTPSLSGFRTTLGKAFLLNQTVGFSGNCGRPLLWIMDDAGINSMEAVSLRLVQMMGQMMGQHTTNKKG